MVLVPEELVVTRVGILLLSISAATYCFGCSDADDASTSRLRSTEEGETLCHDSETAPLSALWMERFDGAAISGVAADSQGNWLVARGRETHKLARNGEVLWSLPFGALVATDPDDNVYVVGGGELRKLDPEGSITFSVALPGSPEAAASSVAVDPAGGAVVSGPGLGTIRLDAQGAVLWSKEIFGQVALDASGDTWLAGSLEGSAELGGVVLSSRGGSDVLLLRMSSTGQVLLARSYGDEGGEQRGQAISVDASGSVLLAGVFDGQLQFGAERDALRVTTCSSDAWCVTSGFVVKLAADGTPEWSKSLGPMRAVTSVAAAASGFVLSGALPGGVRPFRSSWLAALSAQGEQLWRRAEWPETGIGSGNGVAVDSCGNVLWSVSARPDLQSEELSYLTKLEP